MKHLLPWMFALAATAFGPSVSADDGPRWILPRWTESIAELGSPSRWTLKRQVALQNGLPETKALAAATSIIATSIVGNGLLVSEFVFGSPNLEIESNSPGVRELRRPVSEGPMREKLLNALRATPFVESGLVDGLTGEGELRCVDWERR